MKQSNRKKKKASVIPLTPQKQKKKSLKPLNDIYFDSLKKIDQLLDNHYNSNNDLPDLNRNQSTDS